MSNVLGQRYLVRYYEGSCSLAQLERVLILGWITQAEYDRAVGGEPPAGYAG